EADTVTDDAIKSSYDEILALNNINNYSLQRSTLLEIDMKEYMTDEGFYNYYGEEKEEYQDDTLSYLQIISLGDAEYKRYIESLGGNINDYQNGGIIIDDFSYYSSDHYEHYNVYNVSEGD